MAYSDSGQEYEKRIIEELRKKAGLRVPEWKMDTERPDTGTALAMLFADMLADTRRKFIQAVGRYPVRLYSMLGAKPLPPAKARGCITFTAADEDAPGRYLERGFRLSGSADKKEAVTFETMEGVFVSPSGFKSAVYVDGSRDYISRPFTLPLNERLCNRQSHLCFIGFKWAAGIFTEGEITLDFGAVSPSSGRGALSASVIERVQWSYYGGGDFVSFDEQSFSDGRLRLVRDGNMPPFERTELMGERAFWLRAGTGTLGAGEEIFFPGLSLKTEGKDIEPDLIYDGSAELDGEGFLPFGSRPYAGQELYICSDEVFSKKGAYITLSFDMTFKEYPGDYNTPVMPEQPGDGKKEGTGKTGKAGAKGRKSRRRREETDAESKMPGIAPMDVEIAAAVFEYYNGFGFTGIPGSNRYVRIFADAGSENAGEGGRMEISFVCPEDICPFPVSSKEGWCIRLRVAALSNPYAVDGVYRVPRLSGCSLDYKYEEGVLPDKVFSVNGSETEISDGKGGFAAFRNPFPAAKMLYLSFTRPLNEAGIRLLFLFDPAKPGARGQFRYEYYGKNGWEPLNAHDGTRSFRTAGLLSLIGPHDFTEREFFECGGYWLRVVCEAGDGYGSCTLPLPEGVFINSVPIAAEAGSGSMGNLPAGAGWTPEQSMDFIEKTENIMAVSGGLDAETEDEAAKRSAGELRHGRRAVTAGDYEAVVRRGVRGLLKVRCFPGRDGAGKKAPKHITLAVLPREGEMGFESIRENIMDCLRPCMECGLYEWGRLHIVEAERVSVKVRALLSAKSALKDFGMKQKIEDAINAFFDPVTGYFDGRGWRIGTLPTVDQISSAIGRLDKRLYVRRVSLENEGRGPYALAAAGKHEIEILWEE